MTVGQATINDNTLLEDQLDAKSELITVPSNGS